jgi:hypothetical protein
MLLHLERKVDALAENEAYGFHIADASASTQPTSISLAPCEQ